MTALKPPSAQYYRQVDEDGNQIGLFCKMSHWIASKWLSDGRLNGVAFSPTFHNEWLFCPLKGLQEGYKLELFTQGRSVFSHYELIDASLESDKIPLTFTAEEIGRYYGEDGYEWSKHTNLESLYRSVYNQEEPKWVEQVGTEFDYLGDICAEGLENPANMQIKLTGERNFGREPVSEVDLKSIVQFNDLEKMLVPGFALHLRPCSISAANTYKIIRNWVKENIDNKEAVITSDYDFCFTVKKKVKIKPYLHKWEEKKNNGRSYARPRIHTRTVTHRDVTIFEMAPKAYQSYTVIKGFEGKNLEELVENMRLYLEELMFYINDPVAECEHCNGTGHIFPKFDTNKR